MPETTKGALKTAVNNLTADKRTLEAEVKALRSRVREVEGERDAQRVLRMSAEFVLSTIAKGIPFRGVSDPREVATDYLGDKLQTDA